MAAISLGRLSLVLCLSDCPGHGKTEKEKAGGGGGEGPWVLFGMLVTILSTLWVLVSLWSMIPQSHAPSVLVSPNLDEHLSLPHILNPALSLRIPQ